MSSSDRRRLFHEAMDESHANESARVIPLTRMRRFVIDGNEVQITANDHAEPLLMNKREFLRLRGKNFTHLPEDKRIQVDIHDNGDYTIAVAGEPAVTWTDHTKAQKFGQALVKLAEAGAATYLLQQFAFDYGNGFSSFAVNGLMVESFREFFGKSQPNREYYTAQGNGNMLLGMLKAGSSRTASYGLVVAASMVDISLQSEGNCVIDCLNKVMSNPAYSLPILGAAGYLTEGFVNWVGRKAWEYCVPTDKEWVQVKPDLNLIQLLGQYALRWVNDAALSEMLLYYISTFGSQALAANPYFQVGVLLASDAALQLGEYFVFTPYPVNQLVPHNTSDNDVEQGARSPGERDPSEGEVKYAVFKKSVVFGVMCLGAYLVNEVTAAIMDIKDPQKQNTLSNRMIRAGAVLGIPLATKYAVENVAPRLIGCCATLFNRRRAEETSALLVEEPGQSQKNYRTQGM